MNPRNGIRATTLVIIALITTILAWAGLRWWLSSGSALLDPGWLGLVVMVALMVALAIVGWPVKKVRDGTAEHHVSPLRAARALVMAQAGALTGSVLTGWYAGALLALLPDIDVDSVRSRAWLLIVHVILAVGLSVAGMVVQSWCRLLPRDDDEQSRHD